MVIVLMILIKLFIEYLLYPRYYTKLYHLYPLLNLIANVPLSHVLFSLSCIRGYKAAWLSCQKLLLFTGCLFGTVCKYRSIKGEKGIYCYPKVVQDGWSSWCTMIIVKDGTEKINSGQVINRLVHPIEEFRFYRDVMRSPSNGYAEDVIAFKSPERREEQQEDIVTEAKESRFDWQEETVNSVRCY